MVDRDDSLRFDFEVVIVSYDRESGKFKALVQPDSRRYEWREMDGQRFLYDRLDDTHFPEQTFVEFSEVFNGAKLYYEGPTISDLQTYLRSRQIPIAHMLDEVQISLPPLQDQSESFLQSLETDKLGFVIISVDIVDSTKLAARMDPEAYLRLISTVLYELSEVVPRFRGHVLKYGGDGVIAYFPEPMFITKHDLAIDCALTMQSLVHDALKPILRERGFPNVDVRIGLDSGEAYVATIGSPDTKRHRDIIGYVVSLAAKLGAIAKPGEILMGETVIRHLHTAWRLICKPVDLGSDWNYTGAQGNVYQAFRVCSDDTASNRNKVSL
ncbi:MAG: adenylate/guanylate cyclase domain-containing protein [Armatimonadetes bacterium]|nr:adenylate/guanylate cyclase domain-containing protein [Armatimonadota bacterium]